jgi:prepilin peptidase CpaA
MNIASVNPLIAATLLSATLVSACITDLRSRRIPNRLVAVGLGVALTWQALGVPGRWAFDALEPGAVGVAGGLVAALALLVGFFPLYALRIMGAGDVKLLAVVGAFMGASADAWIQLPGLALFVLAAGGVLSLARMAVSGNGAAVLANVRLILTGHLASLVGMPGPRFDARVDSVDRMPYAFAILSGTAAYAGVKWSGLLAAL